MDTIVVTEGAAVSGMRTVKLQTDVISRYLGNQIAQTELQKSSFTSLPDCHEHIWGLKATMLLVSLWLLVAVALYAWARRLSVKGLTDVSVGVDDDTRRSSIHKDDRDGGSAHKESNSGSSSGGGWSFNTILSKTAMTEKEKTIPVRTPTSVGPSRYSKLQLQEPLMSDPDSDEL